MFSLIVVIISILLVAALALTVMYYGGSAMGEGAAKAEASKLINQGQQIMGAADLYKSDTGDWPSSLAVLVSGKYLKAMPEGSNGNQWVMPKSGVPTFVVGGVQKESCKSVNSLSFKQDGVRDKLSASYATQCYAPAAESFKVVVTKAGATLTDTGTCPAGTTATGLPGLGDVECKPVPSDCDDPGWVVKPAYCEGGGPVDPPPPTTPVGGSLRLAPSSIDFGSVPVGMDAPDSKLVLVTNDSVNPVLVQSLTNQLPDFTVVSYCYGDYLQPGDACDIEVFFTPNKSGLRTDTATLAYSDSSLNLGMSGRGAAPKAAAAAPLAIKYKGENYAVTVKNGVRLDGAPTLYAEDYYDFYGHEDSLMNLNRHVFELVNTGGTEITLTDIQMPDYDVPDQLEVYLGMTTSCGAKLGPGMSCEVYSDIEMYSFGMHYYPGYLGDGNVSKWYGGEYQLKMPLSVNYTEGSDNYNGSIEGGIRLMPEFVVSTSEGAEGSLTLAKMKPDDVAGAKIKDFISVKNNRSTPLPITFDTSEGSFSVSVQTGCQGSVPGKSVCNYNATTMRNVKDISPSGGYPGGQLMFRVNNALNGTMFFQSYTSALSVTPWESYYGTLAVGTTARTTITVRNNAMIGIPISNISWYEAAWYYPQAQYPHTKSIIANTCITTLMPGKSCSFMVEHTPQGYPSAPSFRSGDNVGATVKISVQGWSNWDGSSDAPYQASQGWRMVESTPPSTPVDGPSSDTDAEERVLNFISEAGPNVYEVPVTVLPYTDGCSGNASSFNTCARNKVAEGTGKSCNLFRLERSWAVKDGYQSRISCK